MVKEKIINDIFTNLDNPASYTSANRVHEEVLKINPKLKLAHVKDVLEKNPTYTIHRARRKNYKRLKTIPSRFMSDVQVDLADFQKVGRKNKGFKYLLVAVDVLSRRVFAVPTKSKHAPSMVDAFKRLFDTMPAIPHSIYSDKGKEFLARPVKAYLKELDINQKVTQSPDVKAAVAERFIRTIKGRLYKYFTQNRTTRWIDVIDKVTDGINRTKSSVTGMRPIDVNFDNDDQLWERLYGPILFDKERKYLLTKYTPGETVRIAKTKKTFEKSYLPNYTDEIFIVDHSKKGKPHSYALKTREGTQIQGKFYNEELSKTALPKDEKLVIEKVLRTRYKRGLKEYLVQWKNQPESLATWITLSDVM